MDSTRTSRESDFARTPPQDLVAEQSVLGGMMLSKDAIADVVEVLRGNDFYRPSHESIYESIIDLYGRGEPADAVTVADELTKRGEIAKAGGAAYLHQLIQSVPTAANAGFYAEIVAERAVLRRLVTAGTKIVQMGYAQDGEVEDVVAGVEGDFAPFHKLHGILQQPFTEQPENAEYETAPSAAEVVCATFCGT